MDLAALTLGLALIALVFLHAPSTDGDDTEHSNEFPAFQCAENDSYPVIGNVAEEDLHHPLQVLADLQSQFRQHFAPVIGSDKPPHQTSVILFNMEAGYRAYARRVAPALVNSGGIFASTHNRLPHPEPNGQCLVRAHPLANRTAATPAQPLAERRLRAATAGEHPARRMA